MPHLRFVIPKLQGQCGMAIGTTSCGILDTIFTWQHNECARTYVLYRVLVVMLIQVRSQLYCDSEIYFSSYRVECKKFKWLDPIIIRCSSRQISSLMAVVVFADVASFDFTCLLHTYFSLPDVTKTSISGLGSLKFIDKVSINCHYMFTWGLYTFNDTPSSGGQWVNKGGNGGSKNY